MTSWPEILESRTAGRAAAGMFVNSLEQAQRELSQF